jgi:predicted unusual protein kinase regulating ubiquinone biosynthesis (AarF/ABC1/UbiB family)
MITILNENDRKSFIKLMLFVILRQSKQSASVMLDLANYENFNENDRKRVLVHYEFEILFKELSKHPLAKMDIGNTLKCMLEIMRKYDLII